MIDTSQQLESLMIQIEMTIRPGDIIVDYNSFHMIKNIDKNHTQTIMRTLDDASISTYALAYHLKYGKLYIIFLPRE